MLDFLESTLGGTVARSIGDIDNSSTCLDDSLNDTCQILIIRTTSILTVELHIVHKTLGILRSSYGTLQNLFTGGVELKTDVFVAGADARVDTLTLAYFKASESHIDITLYRRASAQM